MSALFSDGMAEMRERLDAAGGSNGGVSPSTHAAKTIIIKNKPSLAMATWLGALGEPRPRGGWAKRFAPVFAHIGLEDEVGVELLD
jgi:hypothetical protein